MKTIAIANPKDGVGIIAITLKMIRAFHPMSALGESLFLHGICNAKEGTRVR